MGLSLAAAGLTQVGAYGHIVSCGPDLSSRHFDIAHHTIGT